MVSVVASAEIRLLLLRIFLRSLYVSMLYGKNCLKTSNSLKTMVPLITNSLCYTVT